jgi:hypothetical protein
MGAKCLMALMFGFARDSATTLSSTLAALFKPAEATTRELDFRGVMGETVWDTFNSVSLQTLPIEKSLLKDLHAKNAPDMIEEVWRSGVLPKHCLVLHRPLVGQATIQFCLCSGPAGWVSWPVQRLGDTSSVRLEHSANAKPVLHHLYSFDRIFIVPTTMVSPLHNHLKTSPGTMRIVSADHSAPVPILEFQAKRGFFGVSEAAMRLLHKELKLEEPDPALAKCDEDCSLAFSLMQHVIVDLTEEQTNDILSWRISQETMAREMKSNLEDLLATEVLDDLTLRSDKAVVKGFLAESKKQADRAIGLMPHVRSMIARVFSSSAGKKKVSKAAKGAAIKCDSRWWATVKGDKDWIMKQAPSRGSLLLDDPNGRYRLSYPDRDSKSYSWTKRGSVETSLAVLRQWWQWHESDTGEKAPLPAELIAP